MYQEPTGNIREILFLFLILLFNYEQIKPKSKQQNQSRIHKFIVISKMFTMINSQLIGLDRVQNYEIRDILLIR